MVVTPLACQLINDQVDQAAIVCIRKRECILVNQNFIPVRLPICDGRFQIGPEVCDRGGSGISDLFGEPLLLDGCHNRPQVPQVFGGVNDGN